MYSSEFSKVMFNVSHTFSNIGFATILCACIQPVMAYFRPHPDTSKRWVFNWLHWFVGNSAYVLAICSIFLAVELPSAELKGKLDMFNRALRVFRVFVRFDFEFRLHFGSEYRLFKSG